MFRYQASHNFIHRKITGLDVLISVGENIADFNGYIQLNSTAVLLWDALGVPRTAAELARLLADKYQISDEKAAADAADFLKLLQDHKMVMVEDDGM